MAAAFRAAATISASVTPRFAAKAARNVAQASLAARAGAPLAAAAIGTTGVAVVAGAVAAATALISVPPTSALMTRAPARPTVLRFGIDVDPHDRPGSHGRAVTESWRRAVKNVCGRTCGVFTTPEQLPG